MTLRAAESKVIKFEATLAKILRAGTTVLNSFQQRTVNSIAVFRRVFADQYHFNAYPDPDHPWLHLEPLKLPHLDFNADLDLDHALHQSDVNLRPLVYMPSTAPL